MLYSSVDHHIHVVDDIETGLEWCANQYELNKVHLQLQREAMTSDGTKRKNRTYFILVFIIGFALLKVVDFFIHVIRY